MKKVYRNFSLFILFTALVIFANSCSRTGKQEFAKKREEWKTKQIGDYRYNLKWVAFSPQYLAGKNVSFEVRDDKNVLIDCPQCETRSPEFFKKFDTMDKVYDFMEKTINTNPYSFEVKYDANFSVPLRFDVEEKGPNTTDDQWHFEISDFQPLK